MYKCLTTKAIILGECGIPTSRNLKNALSAILIIVFCIVSTNLIRNLYPSWGRDHCCNATPPLFLSPLLRAQFRELVARPTYFCIADKIFFDAKYVYLLPIHNNFNKEIFINAKLSFIFVILTSSIKTKTYKNT